MKRSCVVVVLIALLAAAAVLAACGSQASVESPGQETFAIGNSSSLGSTNPTTLPRTITSSTVFTGSDNGDPLSMLMHGSGQSRALGLYEARGPAPSATPGELYLKARAAAGQEPSVYEATAEKILALTEDYKQGIYFDRLRVVLTAEGGEVAFDHTFQVTPPSSTTSTTQPFDIYYSAPSLEISPEEGVEIEVTVHRYSNGRQVVASCEIRNSSGSPFLFSDRDLQLYLDGQPVAYDRAEGKTVEVPDREQGSSIMGVVFDAPEFDPYAAGLLYTSSDPESLGFTASDGPVP